MGWVSDFLIGTEAEAAAKNEANVNSSLGFLSGVDVGGYFDQARGALAGSQGRADYTKAISAVGTAGMGSQLQALQREREAKASNRQQLAQRGLFNSSLAQGSDQGVNAATDRTLAGIAGQTAGAQAGLLAGRGDMSFRNALAQAGTYTQESEQELTKAGAKADVLGRTQHVGSPGALQGALSSFIGGASGAAGAALTSGCCFIAVAAHGFPLDPAVREFRDSKASPRKRRGYYRLSEWLVPKMRRPRVHALVRGLLVDPLTRYARWAMHREGPGWAYWPAAAFWLSCFSVLGLGGPMVRKNGETI